VQHRLKSLRGTVLAIWDSFKNVRRWIEVFLNELLEKPRAKLGSRNGLEIRITLVAWCFATTVLSSANSQL